MDSRRNSPLSVGEKGYATFNNEDRGADSGESSDPVSGESNDQVSGEFSAQVRDEVVDNIIESGAKDAKNVAENPNTDGDQDEAKNADDGTSDTKGDRDSKVHPTVIASLTKKAASVACPSY